MEKTTWEGLWENKEGVFVSKALTKKELQALPAKCKIIVCKNKHYKKDTTRPKYVYCLADAEACEAINLQKEDYSNALYEIKKVLNEGDRLVPLSAAADVCRRIMQDAIDGYSPDDLCVECESFLSDYAIEVPNDKYHR